MFNSGGLLGKWRNQVQGAAEDIQSTNYHWGIYTYIAERRSILSIKILEGSLFGGGLSLSLSIWGIYRYGIKGCFSLGLCMSITHQ